MKTLYVGLIYFQLNSKPIKAESWVDDVYTIKDAKAKKITDKKIIILSGSNSLFGINSDMLSKELNLQVLNLGAHGGLDIDYLYFKLKQYIGKNDIVIMPLEYTAYTRKGYSKWFINNMLVWGNNYIYQLNFVNLLKFLSNINPERVFGGVKAKLKKKIYIKTKKVYKRLSNIIHKDGVKWRGYSYKSLNLDGDFNVGLDNRVNKYSTYPNIDKVVSEHFLRTYKKINDLIEDNNAQLILTHPVTFNTNLYNLNEIKDRNRIKIFSKKLLKKHKILIKCNPSLFHFSTEYAFDTRHHTNKQGALIRSENLTSCMKRILNDNYEEISYDEAYTLTKELEDKYYKITENNINLILQQSCSINEKISFKSPKVIFQGWSNIEKKFRWSLNHSSKIYFKIDTNYLIGNLKLNIHTLGKQEIKLSINGYDLGEQLVNGKNKQINFNFDPTIINKNKINTITFTLPNARRANSKDMRILAIALKSFMLE